MRRLSGERDDSAFQSADEAHRNRPSGRARWDQSVSASRVDQADQALDECRVDSVELASNRMILAAELDSERHRYACNISAAEDGMPARHREQRSYRLGFLAGGLTDLAPPRLVGPPEHRQRQILLVPELVIESAARVPRITSDLFEHQVPVTVAREASRRRFEQRAARTSAALGLG